MTAVLALIIGMISLILVGGGGLLLSLGGSAYYLVSGIVLAVVAFLLWRRRARSATLYGLFFIVTIAWSIWEVGFDGWALLPRLLAPAVLGLLFFIPGVRRNFRTGESEPAAKRPNGVAMLAIASAMAVLAGWGAHLFRYQEPDPIFQNGTIAPAELASGSFVRGDAAGGGAGPDWQFYGGDRSGSRHSTLGQLTARNVDRLRVAWTYRLGAAQLADAGSLPVTPIKIGANIYLCSSSNVVIALDAETGAEVWKYDPETDRRGLSPVATCRGVAYDRVAQSGLCAERIFTNTTDARLIALDAQTGKPCPDFGRGGEISLTDGMGPVTKGYYYASSAPTIVKGRIVVGGWVSDGQYWGEPSGVIRAFDARTGDLAWAFDMGKPDRIGAPDSGETYTRSTPNSWAPMSADEELGLVFVPTGNATPDYYGGNRRSFDDKYGSSVLALDAEDGRIRWSFQTAHHDLWDYDVGSQPSVVTLPAAAGSRKVLVQPTKRGELFLLDAASGKPLSPVTEREVPQGGIVPGERLSTTQPFSDGMPSVRGPRLVESMMWGITPIDQLWCRIEFRKSRYDGPMTPPGLDRFSIVYPGFVGGNNWGGVSYDPDRGVLIVNSLRMANRVEILSREETDAMGVFPLTVESGKDGVGGAHPQRNTPYGARSVPFLSPLGVPCQQPPYGMISGIALGERKVIWTKPFGTARQAGPMGIPSMLPIEMGVPNIGGSITTRGGLTFIGASQDQYFRAYETATGRLLWRSHLPAGGQATPMSYLSGKSGRQFVVIAAGGSAPLTTPTGDYIIAYALPEASRQ